MSLRLPLTLHRHGASTDDLRREAPEKEREVGGVLTPDESLTYRALVRCSSSQARALIPYELSEKLCVLPLGVISYIDRQVLTVAAAEDTSRLQQELRFVTGKEIKVVAVPSEVVTPAIFAAYHGDYRELERAIVEISTHSKTPESQDNMLKAQRLFREARGDASRLLTLLVDFAVAEEATDLHIIPSREGSALRLRIGGKLYRHEGAICNITLHQQIISRIKVLSHLDISNRSMPQDGAFSIGCGNSEHHIRVSTMPTIHGEKAVLRFLGCCGAIPFAELGIEEDIKAQIQGVLDGCEGAILFAGPTGSGKSTTMYSIMHELAKLDLSLATVEDPVELKLDGVAQTSVNPEKGLTYARCLRSVIRQDPDVILIGEIRDNESAEIALQAALTGHLLLSSVHGRAALDVMLRLKHFGSDPLTMGHALKLIVCQKLLPKLCKECRVFDLSGSREVCCEVYKPVGCCSCDYSGFSGVALAAESLRIDAQLTHELFSGPTVLKPEILAAQDIWIPMANSLKRLLRGGMLSLGQVRELL